MRARRLLLATGAAGALAALLVGVPALLIAGLGNPLPSWTTVKAGRLDDTVVLHLLGCVVWIAWLQWLPGTVLEIASLRDGRGLPRRISAGQTLSRALITAIIGVPVSAALITNATRATAAPHASAPSVRPAHVTTTPHDNTSTPTAARPASPPQAGSVFVVGSDPAIGPSLWSIAQHTLHDPLRWREIWQLNRGTVQPDGTTFEDPNLIRPGYRLALPADADIPPASPANDVVDVVAPGDTLTGIADKHDVPEPLLWKHNAGRVMTGGRIFDNPDLIKPGDRILIPAPPRHTAPRVPRVPPPHAPSSAPRPAAGPPSTEPRTETPTSPPASSTASRSGDHNLDLAGLLEVFAGAGALLAAGLHGGLMMRRRRARRRTRPGYAIAAPPPELAPVEKAILARGGAAVSDGRFIDDALHHLATHSEDAALPDVIAARLTANRLVLRLTQPHQSAPPEPWQVDTSGLWWSLDRDAELSLARDTGDGLSPYPTLVGIGYGPAPETEGGGEERWMLDLERAGVIALTGDPRRCLDLARFIAAGLAVNDWSAHTTVTVLGFGEELLALDEHRVRQVDDLARALAAVRADCAHATAAADHAGVDLPTGRARSVAGDSFLPHVLLLAPTALADPDALQDVLTTLGGSAGRSAAAIVLADVDERAPAASWTLELTSDGQLLVPDLDLELIAQRMPAQHAVEIARALSAVTAGEAEPVPAATGDRPYEQFCDAAGGIRAELTLPRDEAHTEMATSTLLPSEDDAYLEAAATTRDDLQVTAPRVPADVAQKVHDSVGSLEDDLAAWRDPACSLPRLTLLGPIELRAHGTAPARRPYHTELAVYLACREHGAQIDQLAEAFGLSNATAQARLKDLRTWLGVNPRTGTAHLPDARKSRASQTRGVSVYEIEDLLVDAELFKRLSARGQARGGEAGIADYETALSLVRGEPFSQGRPGGYEWLVDNRVDEYLKVGIGTVAHTVVTWALERGDPDRAWAAADLACRALPDDEVARMDMIAVLAARESHAAAEQHMREQVCNRDDDGNGPADLPERTEQIRSQRGWLSAAS
jgi:hypothetical protein